MSNKKYQHRRSVETLGLSDNGDKTTIPLAERYIHEIKQIIDGHTPSEPYSSNTLARIKDIVDRWNRLVR